jgi:type II secretory ATPase GspE/PulE/Tfp pilus assembly ATPase PilB-like protein
MLLARGCLSREQLERALEAQAGGERGAREMVPGDRLGSVILRLGLVPPMDLVHCLCDQKGKIDFIAVDDYIIEPALAERLPLKVALSMELLPLVRLDDKTVLVAVAEPLRSDKIDFLRHLTGAEIEQIVVDEPDMGDKVQQCYRAVEARRAGAVRTGELLVSAGLITATQRDWAVAEAKRLQKKLGRVLIEHMLLREEELYGVLAKQKGVTLVTADEVLAVREAQAVAQKLPRNYAVYNEVVPYREEENRLSVVTSEPNLDLTDFATVFPGCQVELRLTTTSEMKRILYALYRWPDSAAASAEVRPVDRGLIVTGRLRTVEPVGLPADPGVRRMYVDIIDNLLYEAVSQAVTHIDIENYEQTVVVRFRVAGKLREVPGVHITKTNVGRILAVLKDMGGLDPLERRRPQSGALKRQSVEGRTFDFRIHTQPALYGENVVIRVIGPPSAASEVLTLELPLAIGVKYLAAARSAPGLMLVVSPTTLQRADIAYATLGILKEDRNKKIITVEDPIERSVSGVVQTEVSYEVGYTFAQAIASFLRIDPNAVYVSELADPESAAGAIRLAHGGALVLAGVRAENLAAALEMLDGWRLRPASWPDELLGVLVRRSLLSLCPACKQPYEPSPAVVSAVYGDAAARGPFYRALGCPQCAGTGRQDQVVLSEYFAPDEAARRSLAEGTHPRTILEGVSPELLIPLTTDIQDKVGSGLIDITEAVRTLLKTPTE